MPRTEYPDTKPDDPMDTFDKGLTLAARLVLALAAVVAVGALVFILLAPTAQAAGHEATTYQYCSPCAGTPIGVRAGSSLSTLLARAVKRATSDVRTTSEGSVTFTVACQGTAKQIVCVASTTDGSTMRPWQTETFTVRHGKLIGHGVVAAPAVASTASAGHVTANQRSALADAKSYLQNLGGFSLKGLVGQVEYDGFSAADATYGATHAGANWNQEAVQDAKSYQQNLGGFSYSGLVGQLEYDGFTPSQAKYGVRATGLR